MAGSRRRDTSSEFEYRAAERRFGAFWVLPLSATTPVGTVDPARAHRRLSGWIAHVEVTSGGGGVPVAQKPLLTPPQLYERIAAVFVGVERTGAKPEYAPAAAGLLLPSGGVVTSFGAVDAAEGLAAELPGGRSQALVAVRTWSRAQDWAILPVDAKAAAALPTAARSPQVGDQCYSLRGGGGSLALAECSVVGNSTDRGGGPRILVEFLGGPAGVGAPVVNRDGELLGIIGGGQARTRRAAVALALGRGTPVVPAALIADAAGATSRTLAELRAQHVLLDPVVGGAHIVSGGFSTGLQRDPLRPLDQRDEFTGGDPKSSPSSAGTRSSACAAWSRFGC